MIETATVLDRAVSEAVWWVKQQATEELRKTAALVHETGLAAKLGLVDVPEIQYLVIKLTLACREKSGHRIDWINDSLVVNLHQKGGWWAKVGGLLSELRNRDSSTTDLIQEASFQLHGENENLVHVFSVVDRAAHLLSASLSRPTNKSRTPATVVGASEQVIGRFRDEIAEARTRPLAVES